MRAIISASSNNHCGMHVWKQTFCDILETTTLNAFTIFNWFHKEEGQTITDFHLRPAPHTTYLTCYHHHKIATH